MASSISRLVAQMDSLYEYDREPVAQHKLQSGWQFAGLFAGEHVAATEFVIGPFFVLHGVTARDLILGLLIGNILAVLSWTFICAPIAVRTRLTLYWYLRKIAGPGLTLVYNVSVALLYCILAGAMISVSATAVGSMIGIATPELTDVLPSSAGWVAITISIGILFTALAILGFEKLSKFAAVCSPWLFPIFIAGAVAMLPSLGVNQDFSNLWQVAETRIWTGVPTPGQDPFNIWHIIFFAWFANLAMHIGLSDMAVFRYAKSWKYGLYSAFGMFPGHMLAWICSGVMVAGINREMNPGLMAFEAAGAAGVLAVAIAGWTTANPTLYRAGLALQSVTPNWPRWKITLAAGAITSVLSCFPVFFMKLLDYVAIYGLILMPMGAIVLVEHWVLPRIGVEQYATERRRAAFNWNALFVWIGTLAISMVLPMHLFFRWLPCFFIAVISYTLLQYMTARKHIAAEARA
jgi:purine-cytosine permease-like protein